MKYYKTPACTPLPHRVGGGGGGAGPRHAVAEGRVSRVITVAYLKFLCVAYA